MGFMDSYKRLDNLCKSFSDYPKGISSYIEVMERSNKIQYRCIGWSSDYEHLKKYRYIRNQISHDNGVYEDEVCGQSDVDWLENFRSRVFNQTDPLGQYFKLQHIPNNQSVSKTIRPTSPHNATPPKSFSQPIGCGACITLMITVSFVVVWLALHIL